MQEFQCRHCREVFNIDEGIWFNNGGTWSMVIICKKCFKKTR